jgi:hypothetical protein
MSLFSKRVLTILTGLFIVIGLAACEPTVEETPDETAPVFSNVANIYFTIGDDAPDYVDNATATDDVDGDVTSAITADSSSVDLETAGTYTVTLTVADQAGNTQTATYDVIVSERVYTEAELLAMDLDSISISASNIDMKKFGDNGSIISWSTSHPHIITRNGFVIKPHVGSGPVTVTLTARGTLGTANETRTFDVTIQPYGEVSVTDRVQLPFEGTSDEYVVQDQAAVDIFYVDNGSVPYIDMETFVDLIDGAIESDEVIFTPIGTDQMEISYEVTYEDFDGTDVTETFTALVDFTQNTFTVNNFGFFENYVASTESDYGEGLDYVDADYVDGEEVTIPLGEYNFDLVVYNDGTTDYYLMPFHVANLLFAGGVYYDVYYNGDKLWGIDTFGISGGDEDDLALQETLRTSSLNAERAPEDIKMASYNFLALALDYFYGLKEERRVNTYYDILALRAKDLIEASDNELYNFMFDFAYDLDDLHTSHSFIGYYADDPSRTIGLSINDLSTRTTNFYEGLWDVQDLIEAKYGSLDDYPDEQFRVLEDGKTAVIYLTGFSIDTPDTFKSLVRTIKNSHRNVENIVVDLSYNTGGNIGAVMRIFGYITEETFYYHSQNPADNSAVTYHIESSYTAYDEYNWYFLTSSVTFSAANMMASMARELGYPIIGQQSSGGASSIGVIMTPDGSCLMISTNNVLSTRTGDETSGYEYESVEGGVPVDYFISDVTNDAQIIAAIEDHQSE